MLWLLCGIALPCWATWLLLTRFLGNSFSGRAGRAVLVCLAFGLRDGLASLADYCALCAMGSVGWPVRMVEMVLAVIVIGICLRCSSPSVTSRGLHVPLVNPVPWRMTLVVGLLLAVAGMTVYFQLEPHGEWDAWNFWNHRARCLYRAPAGEWRVALSPVFRHVDYPLNVPLGVVRGWTLLGSESVWYPALHGTLYTVATIGLLVSLLWQMRSVAQGCLAGLLLLATTRFLRMGIAQYADLPLAFYFLGTVALLARAEQSDRSRSRLYFIAGCLAGLSAWTKNEGLLFVMVIAGTQFLLCVRSSNFRTDVRPRLWLLAGLVPPMLVVMAFKQSLAEPNDIVEHQNYLEQFLNVTDGSRYPLILQHFAATLLKIMKPLAVLIPLCVVLLGRRPLPSPRVWSDWPVWTLMLAGYGVVYLFTPHDLQWHLTTSCDRLILHVWPLILFSLFLRLATPEEVVVDDSARHFHSFSAEVRRLHAEKISQEIKISGRNLAPVRFPLREVV